MTVPVNLSQLACGKGRRGGLTTKLANGIMTAL
jgi:hypothetical protein